jgi:hypothetical protein
LEEFPAKKTINPKNQPEYTGVIANDEKDTAPHPILA